LDLAEYGFRPADTDLDSYRGGTVSFTDDLRLVTISADWIEGELDVSVRAAGGPARSLEAIVRTPSRRRCTCRGWVRPQPREC